MSETLFSSLLELRTTDKALRPSDSVSWGLKTFCMDETWNWINELFYTLLSYIELCFPVTFKLVSVWIHFCYTHLVSFPVFHLLVFRVTLSSLSLSATILSDIHPLVNLQCDYIHILSRFWCFSLHHTWGDWRSQNALRIHDFAVQWCSPAGQVRRPWASAP